MENTAQAQPLEDTSSIAPDVQAANLAAAKEKANEIKKQVFSPDQIDTIGQAQVSAVTAICDAAGVPMIANFGDGEFPEGRAMAIIPIMVKDAPSSPAYLQQVVIAALQTAEHLMTDDKLATEGMAFIEDAIATLFIRKIVAAAKSEGESTLPLSIGDLILSKRAGTGIMQGFNDIASAFVKVLRKGGFPDTFDKKVLRLCLSNAEQANQWFSVIPQEAWVSIIHKMSAFAETQGLPTDIYTQWLAERDGQHVADLKIDLSALDSMAAKPAVAKSDDDQNNPQAVQ